MSGKGEYFLVRNIRSLLGAEVLFSVKGVFGDQFPALPRPPRPLISRKVGFDSCWEEGFENEQPEMSVCAWSGGVVIFSHPAPVEAFQRLFNI